jgi:acyl carrier protein
MDVSETIRQFIVEYFLFGDDRNLTGHSSFIEDGIVDSTGILELVAFLEETFQIQIDDEELVPENLDCIAKVERYVLAKMEGRRDSA